MNNPCYNDSLFYMNTLNDWIKKKATFVGGVKVEMISTFKRN